LLVFTRERSIGSRVLRIDKYFGELFKPDCVGFGCGLQIASLQQSYQIAYQVFLNRGASAGS
jgi:hypothetical protein